MDTNLTVYLKGKIKCSGTFRQDYTFTLNGQTGKLHGKLPISKGKMAKWFGIISGVSFAAIMAFSLIGGLMV
jgi:hypothetical protein